MIAQHLLAWIAYTSDNSSISYWRTKSGVEVDFVIYSPHSIYAIDVKNTSNIRPKDLRGLKAFKEDYPMAKTVLLYRGREKLNKQDVLCMPCEEFLKELIPGKPIIS